MASLTCPINSGHLRLWLHENLIRPQNEGIERVKRAWHGVDFHCIYNSKLSLKDRAISFLIGLFLLIPLFNSLVWKGMETFGKPEILSPPPYFQKNLDVSNSNIEIVQPPSIPLLHPSTPTPFSPISPKARVVPVQANNEVRIEPIRYSETTEKVTTYSDWVLTHGSNGLAATRDSSNDHSEIRYNPNGDMEDYQYISHNGQIRFHAKLSGRSLQIEGEKDGKKIEKSYILPGNFPFIQQVTLGFMKYFPSFPDTLHFYGINPVDEDYPLTHLIAKKVKEEIDPALGKLTKVYINLAGWRYLFWTAEVWFDSKTGILKKMVANSGPFTSVTTTLFER